MARQKGKRLEGGDLGKMCPMKIKHFNALNKSHDEDPKTTTWGHDVHSVEAHSTKETGCCEKETAGGTKKETGDKHLTVTTKVARI